ncbi:hypothetical protein F8A86_07935 [Betaproteobacteria bacterium SCN1]|nr:hypothetical protein F8A86_07935 [Betaproteobacteria bacterium SCN1]MBN8760748.1 hypothetical protein [Thiobacillus sp.]
MPAATLSAKDLQQLAEVASIITAARDAMSDDIVSRVAGAMSEGIILLDRLTRNDGLMRLLQVLDRKESQQLLVALADAMHAASQDIAAAPPATGGIGCMLRVARDPGTQEGVRLLSVIGKHLSESLREQHHRGG